MNVKYVVICMDLVMISTLKFSSNIWISYYRCKLEFIFIEIAYPSIRIGSAIMMCGRFTWLFVIRFESLTTERNSILPYSIENDGDNGGRENISELCQRHCIIKIADKKLCELFILVTNFNWLHSIIHSFILK